MRFLALAMEDACIDRYRHASSPILGLSLPLCYVRLFPPKSSVRIESWTGFGIPTKRSWHFTLQQSPKADPVLQCTWGFLQHRLVLLSRGVPQAKQNTSGPSLNKPACSNLSCAVRRHPRGKRPLVGLRC